MTEFDSIASHSAIASYYKEPYLRDGNLESVLQNWAIVLRRRARQS